MNKKTIVFDARHLKSGIGSYIIGILDAFHKMESFPYTMKLIGNKEVLSKRFPKFEIIHSVTPIYTVYEQYEIYKIARKADILHIPHYNIPVLYKGNLVVTIYDVAHLALQDTLSNPLKKLYARFLFGAVSRKATKVITISDFSKKEIIKYTKIKPDLISTTYCGIAEQFNKTASHIDTNKIMSLFNIIGPYILYVGNIKPHKNIKRMIEAFLLLKKTMQSSLKLVIAGSPDKEYLEILPKHADIQFISNCTIDQLFHLYHGATLHVLFSIYEGFGIPPLEALACRTPTLVSNIPVLRETLSGATLFADPFDINDIAIKMKKMIEDVELRKQFLQNAEGKIASFTWKRAAEKTLELYNKC